MFFGQHGRAKMSEQVSHLGKSGKTSVKEETVIRAKSGITSVTFHLNGIQHTITDEEFGPGTSLAVYIREVAHLTGTKISCEEGGCGACIVAIQKSDSEKARSVNSCLTPVLACDGWKITTVEGIGNKEAGYHPIQTTLAAKGGSQCGFCSPGMVMQLYSWLQEHPNSSKEELDNILDGNLCRCTGYRPILETMQQFSAENKSLHEILPDIEELKICKNSGKPCPGQGQCGGKGSCSRARSTAVQNGAMWHVATSISELTSILAQLDSSRTYRLVAGNTAHGVYKRDGPFTDYININKVPELYAITTSPQVEFGANVSITSAIIALMSTGNPVMEGVAAHLKKIASYGIRNQGTIAGNLMIKNAHTDFPSDVFLSLSTVGATLEVLYAATGAVEDVPVDTIHTVDMTKKVITKIKFPNLKKLQADRTTPGVKRHISTLWNNVSSEKNRAGPEWKYRSFKIMPRSSNAHAYVNAGFLALVDVADSYRIVDRPRIVFGGMSAEFVHAVRTEDFLMQRSMSDHNVFMEALTILAEELKPVEDPVLASPLYRKQLALGLFYKFFLYVLGSDASAAVQSGANDLVRGVTSGEQDWETDENQWPVSQPVEKVEAKVQCSGEAQYVNDVPTLANELQAAYVLTSRANCDIVSVDTSAALAMPGVVAYVDANDIPGANDWRSGFDRPEPVFATGRSEYAGQAVGLIVAKSREAAIAATRAVVVNYANQGAVVTDMEAAMEADPDSNIMAMGFPVAYGDVDSALAGADTVVSGRFRMGSQYHFHMETHVCLAQPNDEGGFDLFLPSQDINSVQKAVSKNLNVPYNSVNVTVKRLGGAYGAKIELPNALAAAATAAVRKLGAPVRLLLSLEDNMQLFGKRNPYLFDYTVGFDASRKIVGVKADIYSDGGWTFNGVDSSFAVIFGQSCYHIPALRFTPYGVRTHTQTHTATRAPGMCNGHAMLEAALEHSAAVLGMDQLELRNNNLMHMGSPILPPPNTLDTDCPIQDMITSTITSSDFDSRKTSVAQFNQANRWKKRGLTMVPMRYDHSMAGYGVKFHCLVSVFAGDGTVSVTVGGIEMGQGLNTKVAQVVARELGVGMEMIKMKSSMAITSPNDIVTGGSAGSESNCMAAFKACALLNERLEPIKSKLGAGATWLEIVQEANTQSIDLAASYMMSNRDGIGNYSVWGVAVTEVEVDILTGEMRVVRVDILEDAGLSTSPLVDIGQVEGAFTMGLGLWTSEEIKFDPTTGELLTKNTWEYKPPAAKDIPEDMRVTLLKNARNPIGFMSSKATGEPALLLAISALFAVRSALNSARTDSGLSGWWQLNGPATVEKIHQHAGVKPEQFVF